MTNALAVSLKSQHVIEHTVDVKNNLGLRMLFSIGVPFLFTSLVPAYFIMTTGEYSYLAFLIATGAISSIIGGNVIDGLTQARRIISTIEEGGVKLDKFEKKNIRRLLTDSYESKFAKADGAVSVETEVDEGCKIQTSHISFKPERKSVFNEVFYDAITVKNSNLILDYDKGKSLAMDNSSFSQNTLHEVERMNRSLSTVVDYRGLSPYSVVKDGNFLVTKFRDVKTEECFQELKSKCEKDLLQRLNIE